MGTLATIRPGIKSAINGSASLVAGGYTLTNARTVLGYVPILTGTEFAATIISLGPYLHIDAGACVDDDPNTDLYTYEVKMHLYFGLAFTSQNDETNIELLAEAIKAQLRDPTKFTVATKPKVTWDYPIIDSKVSPAFGTYHFTVRCEGCG